MPQGVRLYVGSQEGLSVWDGQDGRWQEVGRAFDGEVIDSIAAEKGHPERVLVGVTHDGLYQTEDAGKSWATVLDGDIRSVTVDPTDDRVIYAGTEPVHLYRSEDSGRTWEELASLQRLPEETAQREGRGAAPAAVNRDDWHKPDYVTPRQEWSFPLPPHQAHITNMFIQPLDPRVIYLCIEHGGVARSLDRGETWQDVSEGINYLDIHTIASQPGRSDRYFVATARGFFASDDPARGWTRAEQGCSRGYFHDFLFLEPRTGNGNPAMLVATADGSPGFWGATQSYAGKWDSSAGGSRSAVFRSEDCAQSWQPVGAGRGLEEEMSAMVWSLCHHPTDPNGVFAGVGEVSRGHTLGQGGAGWVLVSRDRGDSWQPAISSLPAVRLVLACPR